MTLPSTSSTRSTKIKALGCAAVYFMVMVTGTAAFIGTFTGLVGLQQGHAQDSHATRADVVMAEATRQALAVAAARVMVSSH